MHPRSIISYSHQLVARKEYNMKFFNPIKLAIQDIADNISISQYLEKENFKPSGKFQIYWLNPLGTIENIAVIPFNKNAAQSIGDISHSHPADSFCVCYNYSAGQTVKIHGRLKYISGLDCVAECSSHQDAVLFATLLSSYLNVPVE